MAAETNPSLSRWPRQIKYIVGNEACERFSYYGMRSILAGYITGEVARGGLGQSPDVSTEVMHLFVFVNYFMPLLGAWLSDKIIGRYRTILWVSLFYCAGHGVLACSDFAGGVHGKMMCLFIGLGLIAFGSGGIKPCVSAFVGDQFKPEQSDLLQKAYGAFYWSINLGSFFSFFAIPWVKNHRGYSAAFAVPGVLMAIATFIFWLGRKHYLNVPPSRETKSAGFFKVFWYALNSKRQPGQSFWEPARNRFTEQEVAAAKSVGPILGLFALIPPFWSLFDQTNSTWVLQGKKMLEFRLGEISAFQPLLSYWTLISICFGLALFVGLLVLIFKKKSALGYLNTILLGAAAIILSALLGWFISYLPEYTIGNEQMQSMNPFLVMILVPILTLLVYPRVGRLASPLRRMSAGMFIAASSFLVVAWLQRQIDAGHQLSVLWQIIPYIILTTAEVLISTTGLEFAFREAAPEMKSLIMSFWLLTVAFGNLLVAVVTKIFSTPGNGEGSISAPRFVMYAGLTFAVAILFSIATTFYHYRDKAAAEGK
jgi:POT family proton-dependent oligopeptide transporter